MSSLEVIPGIPLCLQIGEIGTVLLDVPDVDQTIRISLRDRYKGLPLKAERLNEDFKRNDRDRMWPCVLTGSNQPTEVQNQNDIQFDHAQAHMPLNQVPRIESNHSKVQSNQPTQIQSFQPQNQARSLKSTEEPMQSNQRDAQSNYKDPTKVDVEPTRISAKLIRV